MASEYKKRGGGYNTDKKDQDDSQKNLSKWGEEDWQTKEGSGSAKQEDGTQKRYLPKKAWEEMSEQEKNDTDEKKLEESKEGKQHVANTGRAKSARQKANKEKSDEYEAKKKNARMEEANGGDDGAQNEEDSGAYEPEEEQAKPGQKRGREKSSFNTTKKQKPNDTSATEKKQKSNNKDSKSSKTIGSKHDKADPPAQQASASRLPDKGQTVKWKALPGWVEGEVVEIVRENKEVEGKQVKGKEDDPRIVMRSKNGKIAVHKPEAVYFD